MFGVQFITHHTDTITYLDSVRIALEGGCRWIQLRMKEAPDTQAEEVARQALALCRAAGAVFIIDDRVELAGRLHADGVHLGKADMPVREARRLLGPGFRIGGTANTFEDVRIHYEGGADYIGCGPFRYTTTKQKLAPGARRIPGHNRPYAGGGHRPARGGHRWCDGRGYVCPGRSRTQRYCAQRERIACRRPGGRNAEGHADCETSFR